MNSVILERWFWVRMVGTVSALALNSKSVNDPGFSGSAAGEIERGVSMSEYS